MAANAGARTGGRTQGRDVVVIQDTTEIVVGRPGARRAGFGPVGRGGATRGVLVHAAIVVDAKDGALLGLMDAKAWTRTGGARQADRRRRFADKESHRWLDVCETAASRLGQARAITVVADAESDIYELFAHRPAGVHVLTRSAHDRRLAGGGFLVETVAGFALAGRIVRVIPAAPGRKERHARLELRFGRVEIAAPQGLPPGTPKSQVLSAIEAREVEVPEGATAVHWLLLTSQAITEAGQAAGIVDMYKSRWWIEQLFRTMKSAGFRIEEAEIDDPKAFVTFAGLVTVAAVTIMQLVKARDGTTGQRIADCFAPEDAPLITALSRKLEGKTAKQKNPHPPGDLAFASWVIARLGGWTGYYGKPGPAVINHGLNRFHAIKLGAEIAKDV